MEISKARRSQFYNKGSLSWAHRYAVFLKFIEVRRYLTDISPRLWLPAGLSQRYCSSALGAHGAK